MNLYMNGFEWGTIRELTQYFNRHESDVHSFDSLGYWSTPSNARTGNYCYEVGGWETGQYVVYPAREEVYIQFAMKSNAYVSFYGEDSVFWWNTNSGGNTIGGFGVTNSGQIYLYTWNPAKTISSAQQDCIIVGSGQARLQKEVWYVIEIRIKSHNATGFIEVRVDGVTDIQFSGCTAPAGYNWSDRMGWYCFWSYFIDDIVVNDTTGSNNNSWPDQMKVVLLKPTSQGDYSEWNKEGALLGYDCVNDVPKNASTYVYSTISGQREMYQLEDMPAEANSIAVVRGSSWANRSSKNLSQLDFEVKTHGSIYTSPNQGLYLAPHHTSYAWDVNPNTGAAWTVDEVNNVQGGIKSVV